MLLASIGGEGAASPRGGPGRGEEEFGRGRERKGAPAFHTYHSGLLRFSVKALNMMLKLTLILSPALVLASTECCR